MNEQAFVFVIPHGSQHLNTIGLDKCVIIIIGNEWMHDQSSGYFVLCDWTIMMCAVWLMGTTLISNLTCKHNVTIHFLY